MVELYGLLLGISVKQHSAYCSQDNRLAPIAAPCSLDESRLLGTTKATIHHGLLKLGLIAG